LLVLIFSYPLAKQFVKLIYKLQKRNPCNA
jgi:hypothetical protein